MATGDATAQSMLTAFTDAELFQLCSGNADGLDTTPQNIALFRNYLLGGDISSEPVDVQAGLETAKAVFDEAILVANSEKNVALAGYEIYDYAAKIIERKTCDIARYHLETHENKQLSTDSGEVSDIQKRYEAALKYFDSKNGCKICGSGVVGEIATTEFDASFYTFYTPNQCFTDEYFGGWNTNKC